MSKPRKRALHVIEHRPGDSYDVTGVTTRGKRFIIHTESRVRALSINLWRGSVWLVRTGEPRRLLKRVWN